MKIVVNCGVCYVTMERKETMASKPKKGEEVHLNAQRPLRIDVSDDDIKKGTPLDPEQCAIAQCILRQFKAHAVRVHRGFTYVQRKAGGPWTKYLTSSSARLEQIVYDRGGRFVPGFYDLKEIPVSLLTRETRKKPKSPSAPRTKREMDLAVRRHTIPGVRRSARQRKTEEGEE